MLTRLLSRGKSTFYKNLLIFFMLYFQYNITQIGVSIDVFFIYVSTLYNYKDIINRICTM